MKTSISKVLIVILFMFISGKSFAFMFWNQACGFPGASNGYAVFGNSASLNITGSFTIEMWINPLNSTVPGFQILTEKRSGTGGNGYTLYLNQGRVAVRTNSSTRLVGNTILQNNQWTHICGAYNSSNDLFSIFINGILDTSVLIQNAEPVANADSLRIGKGNVNSPFAGQMDEIRIWNRTLTMTEVYRLRKSTLGVSSGIYSNLIFSLTFQDRDSQGTDFSLFDWTGNNGTGKSIGVSAINYSDRPSNTIVQNDCIELNGVNDYLCGVDNPDVSPVNAITMEAWINPGSVTGMRGIISKGTGASVNYSLRLNGAALNAVINGISNFNSTVTLLTNIWTHVCFTYNSSTGEYNFYVNGREAGNGINSAGMINNGTDSLVIGSNGIAGTYFNGFIDEVRISNYVKTRQVVNRFLYISTDRSNKPNSQFSNVVYNFDGYAYDNSDDGPVLEFKNSAGFSHNGTTEDQPVSPVNRSDRLNFSDGFRINQSIKRIPSSGISGIVIDSFEVCQDTLISDLNLFMALNHTAEEELNITLISPDGASVNVYGNSKLADNSDNLITIFNDQADSNLNSSASFTSFAPEIKPKNSLNTVFSGKRTSGTWRIVINDQTGAGAGNLYAWGIQFNNSALKTSALCLKVYMEGFYRSVDSTVIDTITTKLREEASPYNDVGIKGETPDEDLIIRYNFPEADFIANYWLQVNHRNSIEVWSDTVISFEVLSGNMIYDFTKDADAAYGSNQTQVENTPARFAIYSADVNQDGVIDLTDNTLVDNDALAFAVGYVVTDVNGDESVDITDQTLADNNSYLFITKITP